MRKLVGFIAVVALALVLLAAPGYAISGVNGKATTDNTVLKVQVGSTVVKIATDVAEAVDTTTSKAISKFITGQVGTTPLPGGKERSASKSTESGQATIGTGTKSIAGLASVNLSSGTIDTTVASDKVSSAVDFTIATLNALGGFTNVATARSNTDSVVGSSSSTVTRSVTIGDVDVLDLRTLLDQLGIDPLALACAAVADAGTELDVDTSAACATLTSATGEITDGNAEIGDAEAVIAALETTLAPLCALAPAGTCDSITAEIDALQADIDAYQSSPPAACATLSGALDDVSGQLTGIVSTLEGLTGGALGDLTALISSVTGAVGGVDTAKSQLDSACNTLLGIVDSLLDIPILTLDGIKISMDLSAKPSPSASVAGSIGALKVGNVTVVDADDLVAYGSKLQAAIDDVNTKLSAVFDALGVSGLPVPEIDLLQPGSDEGRHSDGTYFAWAKMTALHVGIPAATVDVPSTPPLGALEGLGGFSPASVRIAAVNTPAVNVNVGVFDGSTTWQSGGVLPNTGVGGAGLAIPGLLTLAGAGLLRRVTRRF